MIRVLLCWLMTVLCCLDGNASPGELQTVQTTGGADNHFEFAIQGLAGNRIYSVDYN